MLSHQWELLHASLYHAILGCPAGVCKVLAKQHSSFGTVLKS